MAVVSGGETSTWITKPGLSSKNENKNNFKSLKKKLEVKLCRTTQIFTEECHLHCWLHLEDAFQWLLQPMSNEWVRMDDMPRRHLGWGHNCPKKSDCVCFSSSKHSYLTVTLSCCPFAYQPSVAYSARNFPPPKMSEWGHFLKQRNLLSLLCNSKRNQPTDAENFSLPTV